MKKTGLVFQRTDGEPLVLTRLDQQHRRLRKLLKFPEDFVLHSFRHTFGTRLGKAGVDAFTIMRLMGHSTVVVSQRYVHPTPETLQTAIGRVERLYGGTIENERDGVGTISGTLGQSASRTIDLTN